MQAQDFHLSDTDVPPQRVTPPREAVLPFEITERFLNAPILGAMLQEAFKIGLIDALLSGPKSEPSLFSSTQPQLTPEGFSLMGMVLVQGEVVRKDSLGRWALCESFHAVLPHRRLLLARLWFAQRAAADLLRHMGAFLSSPQGFMQRSEVFSEFRYDRCLTEDDEAQNAAQPWVHYTSALTSVEALALVEHLDLLSGQKILDIGGNNGELALALKAKKPLVNPSVFDLPAVCALGEKHAGAAGISFVAGDLRRDALPSGQDLVVFKSLLHDWPEENALHFIEKAAAALRIGGEMVIFERIAVAPDTIHDLTGLGSAANLVFQPFYRSPSVYRKKLRTLGFAEKSCQIMRLDMDFILIRAAKTMPLNEEAVRTPYPGLEISENGLEMLRAVEALGCEFGFEHSIKFTEGSANADRYVISLDRTAFGEDGPREFCLAMGAPAEALEDLLHLLPRAGTLHLGYEGGRTPKRKLYLEFNQDIASQKEGVVLVFDALKWDCTGQSRRDKYTLDLSEADPVDALSRWDCLEGEHPGSKAARQISLNAERNKMTRMDVFEEGAPRRSFDLNLYRLARPLKSIRAPLEGLISDFRIENKILIDVLDVYGESRLGHIAGGIAPDGAPFATIYFGLQGRRGTEPVSLLLPSIPQNEGR